MQKLISKVSTFARNRKVEFVFLIGLALVILGSFLCVVFPMLLGVGLDMNFKLEEGKFIYDIWKEVPIPITTKMYLFNIENAEAFKNGAVPVVREVGPYVYKQYRTREAIEWSQNNQKIKFWETLVFEFDEEKSAGTLSDKVTLVNVPLLLIFSIINSAVEIFPLKAVISPIVNNVVNTLLASHRERLIETRTVGEVINGRRIGLLDTIDIVAKPLRLMGLPIPEYGISAYKLRENKYGFLAIRNNSKFGPFEMYTGEDSGEKFMKYATYMDRSRIGIYRHESCDALNGTDGTMFGSFIDASKPIYLFNVHACRSFKLEYVGDTSVSGVSAYRYEFGDNLFDGPEYNRENWCFCPKNVEARKCHGLLDLSQCLAGVPFALTFPHFLNSPRFLAGVQGLNPDREKHLGFFEIEPTLGATLRGAGRFQINLKLRPFTFVPGLNNFRPTLLPYLWLDEGAMVDGWLGFLLKAGSWSINGANYAFVITIFLGTAVVLFTAVVMFKKRKDKKSQIPTESNYTRNITQNTANVAVPIEDTRQVSYTDKLTQLDINELQNRISQRNSQMIEQHWIADLETGKVVERQVYSGDEHQRIYPDLNQINGQFVTNVKSTRPDSKASIESKSSQRSVFQERHSSHSNQSAILLPPVDDMPRNEVMLPPVEDGETHTTVIIQRKPYANQNINSNNS